MKEILKPAGLRPGDRVAVVSLSKGILGEEFCRHDLHLGATRLNEFGLMPEFMPNSLQGVDYLAEHPEARAADLKRTFQDDAIRGIFCAIGGDDTYRTVPYLMDDPEFVQLVMAHPKVFSGFSDTTVNHLMFWRLGLSTFYGPNFINDLAELGTEMLPYTMNAFGKFLAGFPNRPIESSPVWYEERTDFSESQIDVSRIDHPETHGYELLQGEGSFSGALLGGCTETICDLLTGNRHPEAKEVNEKYRLFPEGEEWDGKICFLETSEEKPEPSLLAKELDAIAKTGVFDHAAGVLIGKPQDEVYYEEYKAVYQEKIGSSLPILYNVNFGHAYPRTVLAIGQQAVVDPQKQEIRYLEPVVKGI